MKINFILASTLLPFVIIWQLFAHQKEQINPKIVFKREIHEITNKIVDEIQLPDGCSPNYLEIQDDNYFVSSIENKNFISINREKEVKIYPTAKSNDALKLVISFKVDKDKIKALDQTKRKLVEIDIKTGIFVYTELPKFSRGVQINDTTLLLVSVDSTTNDIGFFRYNLRTKERKNLKMPLSIVPDFGLANDGFFVHSADGKQLIYVLYHLGKIVRFDEKLENNQLLNTLDNYNINPVVVKEGSRVTLSSKAVTVNVKAAFNERFMFIVSRIRSVEDTKNKIKGELIDLYDTQSSNKYKFSIHLDNNKVRKILDIKIRENFIYVMTLNDSFRNEILKIDISNLL